MAEEARCGFCGMMARRCERGRSASLATRLACGDLHIPFEISMQTHRPMAFASKSQSWMMMGGMMAIGILAHSCRGRMLLRKKSLMSVVMNRAPSVEMTLLNRSFEVTTSLVLVVTSPGQSTLSPPTVIRTLLVSVLRGRSATTMRR